MAVVRCERCDMRIDLDWDCEVFTNDDIKGLSSNDLDYVCLNCLTDEEAERCEDVN